MTLYVRIHNLESRRTAVVSRKDGSHPLALRPGESATFTTWEGAPLTVEELGDPVPDGITWIDADGVTRVPPG